MTRTAASPPGSSHTALAARAGAGVEGQGGGPARVGGRRAFSSSLSLCVTSVGNLPALFRPGPSSRGICLITDSDARKAGLFGCARAPPHVRSAARSPPRYACRRNEAVRQAGRLPVDKPRPQQQGEAGRGTWRTKLLHELLVLVQLLQLLHRHGVHADRLGLLAVLVVAQHAHLPARARRRSGRAALGGLPSAHETTQQPR